MAICVSIILLDLVTSPSHAQISWTVSLPLDPDAANTTSRGLDQVPQLVTDGAGTWIAVWESGGALGGTIGPDDDILYARSVDNGKNWTPPAALNTNAAADTSADVNPQLATDGAGNWICVWASDDSLGGTIGTDMDILYARSSNNGITWTVPAPLNANAATDGSDGFGEDSRPVILTDRAGIWIAVWQSSGSVGGPIGADYEIVLARSVDNGLNWTAPAALDANVASDTTSDESPHVATDGAGTWIAVWHAYNWEGGLDYDILFARSTDGGVSWTSPSPLYIDAATDPWADGAPHLTSDGAGTWIAVWESNNPRDGGTLGGDFDILQARSVDSGQNWTAPIPLNANADGDRGFDTSPHLTADGNGTWIAVWQSWDSLGGTIGEDDDVLYALSADGGMNWSFPAALNTHATSDTGFDRTPSLATDKVGTWIALWSSNLFTTGYDILSAKAELSGAIAGAVTDVSTGAGLTCSALRARSQGNNIERTATTDLNGDYQFVNLPGGTYTLEAFSPGYEAKTVEVLVVVGAEISINIDLNPAAGESSITGQVTDAETGNPLGGVRVTSALGKAVFATTYTCAQGRYDVSEVPAKATRVTLEFSGFGYETRTADVELAPGEPVHFEAQLLPKAELLGSLVGTVKNAVTGDALPGARVTATRAAIGPSIEADILGYYFLDQLASGQYETHVSMPGYASQTRTVAVFLGTAPSAADFLLEPDGPSSNPSDINSDNNVNAVDVQLVINAALGLASSYNCDVDHDGYVNAVDVQLVINAALGLH
ncbi:MAG: carboxypeptidase regulatory-like domain-containing protein [Candidatus Hydrogenedentes bacterium]|nr:carboxypeptidase regulatory-like domain-containing protein [Candidatus Hydrogenedentota bacterium]